MIADVSGQNGFHFRGEGFPQIPHISVYAFIFGVIQYCIIVHFQKTLSKVEFLGLKS